MPGVLANLGCAGGAAVITVTFIHPIDTVKTRLQVSGTKGARNYAQLGIFGTISVVAKEEGITAFWKGIPAAWLREASYTSFRLGLYKPLKVAFGADKKDSPFILKFCAGGASGGLGSMVGNPFDILKTRMMASEKGVGLIASASTIYKASGILGFYRGLDANIMRAIVNNGTKMACYDTSKNFIKNMTGLKEGVGLQTLASAVAGFFMTCTVTPFDMCRTRLMNQPSDQPKVYFTIVDTFFKVAINEGPLALWKGFIPAWARIAPTTTCQLILFEQFTKMAGIKAT
uniref:Mitochondrial carrier protein n=1 Tax=Aureoumbra lagunensis TaxID=44058 RepID=A0A7S3JS08_9STRA|mmetsp:Transcript_3396/g.4743  ORF Transcript_3396/g.4743 Transcript_3396/m.4743 type:complete len:287 (+) Transcript_3396:106-966(+)|eukprot:CAMPEP_0197285032 /NCGR_PEP_ID=MMETSP0890-20130614/144_1 /TAXON_ID=44058 ORGANISM="Aureoumbra lagunensis, Strain CCMP1510" /NCGR_SAMPLE_ID=MMETSP0890 /ASSEMBLY_ACC=CAM_ASM_000533 /LENGTH=286 /DNA_ID=CAMNT_0042752147 /DNA_START=70 /DNA_END=930 /DNA_ORIENTATION=+